MSSNKELTHDEYCSALKTCWDVPMNHTQWFNEDITEWINKKCMELGVPFPYVAYPLITSVAYALGVSHVKVSSRWNEPVILYTLVSGRSGTNKSGSLATMQAVMESLCTVYQQGSAAPSRGKQVIYDSGTMEGLMTAMNENNGSVLCAVDEFSSFVDSMDKNSNGNSERSRLSLWSGCWWRKNTKQGGK